MKLSSIIIGLSGLSLASHGHAAAPEVEIGGEYQVNATYSNDGLNDPNDVKKSELNLKGAKINLRGKLSDQITWNVLFKAKESELERFWLTNKINDNLDVSIGKQKIKTYGLHRKLSSSTTTPVTAAYLANNPLTDKTALDITYKLAGTISLQLVEDYNKCADKTTSVADVSTGAITTTTTSSCTSWNTAGVQKQPALSFEWYGAFGEFSPLVQYSVYDLGKSNAASVGLRFKSDKIDSYFDYTVDTRTNKGGLLAATGKYEEQKNTYNGLVVYGEYKLGAFTPFLHFSSLNTDPFTAATATEADKVKAESNSAGKLDKNESTLAVGTHFENWGTYYRPFVHVALNSGHFVDPNDSTKKKDLSKTDLVLGLIGKF